MISYQVQEFGRPLAQALRDTPSPTGSELLLRVDGCGLCHSDVHLHDGYFDLGDGKRVDLTRSLQPPRTLGHEIVATVVAAGPDAAGVQVGDRRVVYPWIGCGKCALCAAGNEHLCSAPRGLGIQRDGGFADHVLMPHARYLFDFGAMPAEQACTLACAGITAFSALRKAAPLAAGERLLIIGAGGVGLSAIRMARQMFDAPPLVAEIDRSKWDLAREAGAGDLIDPTEPTAIKSLMAATGGGVAAAIDFVGAGSSFAFGLGALRKAGHLICVGLFGGSTPLSPALLALKAVRITGSYVGSLREMGELMALARAGQVPPLPINTRPLAEADAALADLKAGRIRGRTVLVP